MVKEVVQFDINPGSEAEFEAAMDGKGALLAAARGCTAVALSRCAEKPATYLLVLDWVSIDAHIEFTRTAEFAEFGAMFKRFIAGKPTMLHFNPCQTWS